MNERSIMSSIRQQIVDLQTQIKILDGQYNKIREDKYKLFEQHHALSILLVKEAKLLQTTTWSLQDLECSYRLGGDQAHDPELDQLLRSDYYCGIFLEKDVELRFYSHNRVSLDFDTEEIMYKFIKDFKLIVQTPNIDEDISNLQKKLELLQTIKAAIKC